MNHVPSKQFNFPINDDMSYGGDNSFFFRRDMSYGGDNCGFTRQDEVRDGCLVPSG